MGSAVQELGAAHPVCVALLKGVLLTARLVSVKAS